MKSPEEIWNKHYRTWATAPNQIVKDPFVIEAMKEYANQFKEENERLRAALKDSKQTLLAAKVEIDENEYKEPWDKEPTLFCIRETLKKIENL
jgi:hypothetical protein